MNAEKEKRAIQYLKMFEPQDEPYYLCYSGGKDSDCIRILAGLAGVKHDIVHNLATVDAPETVRYIKSIPGIIIERPELSMWALIKKKMYPPTRLSRYCCSYLKESGGCGRLKISGVRWAESERRREGSGLVRVIGKPEKIKKMANEIGAEYRQNKMGGIIFNDDNSETRRVVEHCYRTTSTMLNPIVDWTDEDVWDFLHHYGCGSNPLYQCGYKRVGCVGCPLGGYPAMKRELNRYPKYRSLYIRTFDQMLMLRESRGLEIPKMWRNGEDVMKWWIGDNPMQIELDFEEEL